jgi:hypothetical protein
MSSAILRRIAELTQPVSPPQPWNFLRPVGGMRQRSMGVSQFMEALCREFPREQLETARVLVRRQNCEIGLSPILAGETSRGLFLRRREDAAPFDIVNQQGALATDDPPAFGAVRDYYTQSWSGQAKLILTAFSDDDLAVLRMLSLPCTPAAGLAELNGRQARSLYSDPEGLHDEAATQVQVAAVTRENYRVTLVGWRVAELSSEKPEGLNAVVSRLLKAQDAFGFNTPRRFGVWQPTATEFARIASGIEFADRSLVRALLWQSANHSTYRVREYVENPSRDLSDYRVARRELLRAVDRARERGFWSSEVAESLKAFNRSFDRGVVDAIVNDAMLAADSVDRSLLLAAAELMGHWHESSPLVRSAQEDVAGRVYRREEALHSDELQERLRVVDGLVKLHRELTRGR